MQKIVTLPSEFSEIRGGLVATDGGFALTTTLQCIDIPFGADWMSLTARNFSGCATIKFAINPYLTIIATTNSLITSPITGAASIASESTHNISAEMQDGDTTEFAIDDFPLVGDGGYFYVGSPIPFRGVYVDVGTTTNTAANTLTVNYWNGGVWTDTSNGDNTKSTGSFELDGTVEWTPSATWARDSLVNIGDTTLKESWSIANLYWTRWEWDIAMDSSSDIVQMQCLNRSTNYAQLIEGQSIEQRIHTKSSGISVGNIEALASAGTANLIVNCASVSFGGATPREIFE